MKPDNIGLSGVGRIFGHTVTELVLQIAHAPGTWNSAQLCHIAHHLHTLEVFISLFRDSFPALRSLTVRFGGLNENPEFPSWLHVIISTGRPIPGILKRIVLCCTHYLHSHKCCREAVGTSEEVVGSAQRLPDLLPELEELVIRMHNCDDPERHAAYIWDVLPGIRNVLRFEYREGREGDWKPYTVLPQDVPRRLAQNSDADSDSHL